MNLSAYSFTSHNWLSILQDEGQSAHVLPYWLDGLYKNRTLWSRHIAPNLQVALHQKYDFRLPQISQIQVAADGTTKFQMRLQDGLEVETVLIPFHKRMTVCLSTQVGCGMNCSFCFTGTQGLKRNLTVGEITGQYLKATEWLKEKNASALSPSIVFMGQGEPLHNAENVMQAIKVLSDTATLGIGLRQMTLSTVGYLPGMEQLQHFPKINFALSLHSPFDEERNQLIPINQRFPLADVMASLDKLVLMKRQFITFEYLLIQNFNMSEDHADKLQELLGKRKAIMNLIPFNPFPGSQWLRPTDEEVESFKQLLVKRKLRVMVRTTKGQDILAACGQLKIPEMARTNYATRS